MGAVGYNKLIMKGLITNVSDSTGCEWDIDRSILGMGMYGVP
jgi:hypothetical protein